MRALSWECCVAVGGITGADGWTGGVVVREALDQLELVSDLSTLLGNSLLGPETRCLVWVWGGDNDGSLLLELLGAGAFLEGDLSQRQHISRSG